MALFRTVMIGLICAGFTTAGYAVDNDDGVTRYTSGDLGRNRERTIACPDNLTKNNVKYIDANAYGNCKNGKWTFTKCINGFTRVLSTKNRFKKHDDYSTYPLTIENYCAVATCSKPPFVLPITGEKDGVVGLIKFYRDGFKCKDSIDFCNTAAAVAAIEGATHVDVNASKIKEVQAKIDAMSEREQEEFFNRNRDTQEYQEYCCATKCRTPEYEEKPQGCKCVKKKADPKPEVKKHSIEYRCEGGIGCEPCQPKEYTVGEKTTVVPRCEPTRDGYSHIGWYRNPSDEVAWSYVITETETANPVILHAKWQKIPQDATKYKIRYYLHADDAQSCPVGMPEEYVENVGANITCQPTRDGFEFIGWCEGEGIETCENPEKSYLIGTDARGDKYMHAMWKKIDTTQSAGAICTTNGCSTGVDVFKSLENKLSRHFSDSSVWKDDEGKFNTARLASDSIAGVVLGTVGGVVTSVVMKKHQAKEGFEDLRCTINGQAVAEYGDEFYVGMTEIR